MFGSSCSPCCQSCQRLAEPDSVQVVLSSQSVDEFIYGITCRHNLNGQFWGSGVWDLQRSYRALLGDLSGTYELTKYLTFGPNSLSGGIVASHTLYRYVDKHVQIYMTVTTGDYAVGGFWTAGDAMWTMHLWFPVIAQDGQSISWNQDTQQPNGTLQVRTMSDMVNGAVMAGNGELWNVMLTQICTRGESSETYGSWEQSSSPLAAVTADSLQAALSVQGVSVAGKTPVSQTEDPSPRTVSAYSYFEPQLPFTVNASYPVIRPACGTGVTATISGNPVARNSSSVSVIAIETQYDNGSSANNIDGSVRVNVPIDVTVESIALVYDDEEISLPI